MRTCEVCLEVLPLEQFKDAPLNTDGYSKWCISCSKEYFKEYSKKRRDKNKLKNRMNNYCSYIPKGGPRIRSIQPTLKKIKSVPTEWIPNLNLSLD
jgi:hypothetical protein